MTPNNKLRLFISYSHQDEDPYVKEFKRHISTLENNALIEYWYDRKIIPGEDYQNKINNNLEDADIICLFISANFLSSKACMEEKNKALELKRKKCVAVIPIILSPCAWQDCNDISNLLALPRDGIPISTFQSRDVGWLDVYEGIKKVVEQELKFRQLEITDDFKDFLQETQMLTKAHSKKETLLLEDIFIYPELDKFSELRKFVKTIGLDELLQSITDHPKLVIAGENLSGKTTICKILFKELRKRNFVPVYIYDKNKFAGKIESKITDALKTQYKNFDEILLQEKERIVPIVDDFHTAKNKEKHIKHLLSYRYCILIVDDIFRLNIKDDALVSQFIYLTIRELKPSLRYELVKKWCSLSNKEEPDIDYQSIDHRVDLINQLLGKNISKSIFPSYPFFILSAILTYETFAIPLNEELTSQGYCYQALIYFYLRKQGVINEDIDIYINFLTELAYYFYHARKVEISDTDFNSFITYYSKKYSIPITPRTLIKNLNQIISIDSFHRYSFRYPYLYYFFVAKYLVEHIEDKEIKNEIEKIANNLHIDEYAYIMIFMAHHSRSVSILDEIELNALFLFDKYSPAKLTKEEVQFFDEEVNKIIQISLPPATTPPEKVREEILAIQDKIDQLEPTQNDSDINESEEYDPFEKDLRRAIRSVEVIGCVIKNRAGSIEKKKLEEMFTEAMNVHLRFLSLFFDIIRNKEMQKSIIRFLLGILTKIIEEKEAEQKRISMEKIEEYARTLFWNINFFVVVAYIHKIIRSLGSDKLIEIINKVCNETATPATFLVKHGVLMWYCKNLQIDEIAKKIKEKDFSIIAEKTLKLLVVNHCALHEINYRDRQRIEALLNIPIKRCLPKNADNANVISREDQ
ncbi:MAG: toll/interleukin-1 receptor domain-containing protein [candidate division WOR-3 bacterium]|jgi:hypothetical protein|nr:toll/interleukin-1 receptor domain-containing protein [candidate division WOR-3 bacterium]MDH7519695.1 toll/interleukin-1 receptor domain-containing protein [bacterium]